MSTAETHTPEPIPADDTLAARLLAEGFVGMQAAARLFGSFRDGAPTHPSTVTRWALKGVRLADGRTVALEAVRVGGRLVTSRQAIVRFVNSQQPSETNTPTNSAATLTPRARRRAEEAASREADRIFGAS